MKKIIEGKTYDTATAEVVARWDNGLASSDLKYAEETVYRTDDGQFLFKFFGRAKSIYQNKNVERYADGVGIMLITEKAALAWLKNRKKTDAIEKFFGNQSTGAE